MASRQEEEFELVLGNKQLLSLLFVVVGFFATFFAIGYTVGYNHGADAEPTPEIAGLTEEQDKDDIRLPDALLEQPPKEPPKSSVEAKPKPAPKAQAPKKPQPTQVKAPKPKPAPPKPAPKPAAAKPKATPAAATVAGGRYHLQVAAFRMVKDANLLAARLKGKGFPVNVNSSVGDGWNRVLIGPFASEEAAKGFRPKLKAEGFDTMIRKL